MFIRPQISPAILGVSKKFHWEARETLKDNTLNLLHRTFFDGHPTLMLDLRKIIRYIYSFCIFIDVRVIIDLMSPMLPIFKFQYGFRPPIPIAGVKLGELMTDLSFILSHASALCSLEIEIAHKLWCAGFFPPDLVSTVKDPTDLRGAIRHLAVALRPPGILPRSIKCQRHGPESLEQFAVRRGIASAGISRCS